MRVCAFFSFFSSSSHKPNPALLLVYGQPAVFISFDLIIIQVYTEGTRDVVGERTELKKKRTKKPPAASGRP